MKPFKELEKEYKPADIAESFVFPGIQDEKERNEVLSAFRKFRKEITVSRDEETRYKNQLLQLKFLMEDYLTSPEYDEKYDFAYFLSEYISRLQKNFKEFAKDIAVEPSTISQIIGKHRKPTDKIIYRLHIHSNTNFPAEMWYRLLEKERVYELRRNQSILKEESKYVKHKLTFSI